MTGLVLKLKPNEKFLINGIEMQNGDRASRLRVRSNDVAILRASDAIAPNEASTPLRRIYYISQLALAGEADADEAAKQIEPVLKAIEPIFSTAGRDDLTRAAEGLEQRKFFIVMRSLKKLFPLEHALLKQQGAL